MVVLQCEYIEVITPKKKVQMEYIQATCIGALEMERPSLMLVLTKACKLGISNILAGKKSRFQLEIPEFLLGKSGTVSSAQNSAYDIMSAWLLSPPTFNKISPESRL